MRGQGSQFLGGVSLQGDETVEDTSPNGLKNIDDLALKTEYVQINFGVLWCSMFERSECSFHSYVITLSVSGAVFQFWFQNQESTEKPKILFLLGNML